MIDFDLVMIAICFGVFIIVGGSIIYNLWAMAQNRKGRRKR